MSIGLGTAIGYLNLDISGFARGVDSAISDMGRLNGSFNTASQSLQSVGGIFSKAGTALTAGFTAPVVGFGAASVKAGMEFDKQMSNVKAVTGATSQELEDMRDAARDWGKKTAYSATEAGEALYYMGLAGWDSNEAIAGLGPVLNLAAAGNLDLGRTSDIVTDALTAFGYAADDTAMFTDVLAAAMSNSNTDVDQLGEAFKYVGSVAGAFEYSIQDTALMLGLFANNGVKASQAGTGMRQALNALINPSDKAAAVMDQYGVSLFNADGSSKDLMTVMQELRGTFGFTQADVAEMTERVQGYVDGMAEGADETQVAQQVLAEFGENLPASDMEKLTALVQMFGVRALPGMLSVINASEKDFNDLSDAIYNSDEAFVKYEGQIYTMQEALDKFGDRVYNDDSFEILGAAAGMAEIQLDNLAGDWIKFTSALGETKIIISDMAKGALREFVQKLTDLVNKFNDMDPAQQEQIVKWAMMAAAIGPVLIVIGKVISIIGTLMSVFDKLKGAFTFIFDGIKNFISILGGISAPILAIIAIVAILAAAFMDLWKNNEEFRNKIIEIWEGIKAKFEEVGQKIVDIVNTLGFDFEDFGELMSAVVEGLIALWNGFCEILAPVFIGAFEIISAVIGGIVDLFVGIIEIIVGIIKGFKDGDWTVLWQGIGDVVMAAVNTMIGIIGGLAEIIWGVVETIAGWFGTTWSTTWEDAKQAVADWFNSIVDWFKELPEKIGSFVGSALDKVVNWTKDMISQAKEVGSKFLANIINFFKELPGNISKFITSAFRNVTTWVKNMISKARELGRNFLSSVVEFFSQLPYNIGYLIGLVLGNIIKWSGDMISKARETGANFLANIVDWFKELPGRVVSFTTSTFRNVVNWVSDMIGKAKEVGYNFLVNVINGIKELPGKLAKWLASALDSVKRWIQDMFHNGADAGIQLINGVVEAVKNLPNTLYNVGVNIVGGIWKGIKAAKEVFENNVKNFFTGIVDGVKRVLGIKSPSKVFADEVGYWLPLGVSEGFDKSMPTAIADIEDSLNEGIDSIKADDISVENTDIETQIDNFVEAYRQVFEELVIWFETMEERMSKAIEGLVNYFEYLMYIRQIIDSNDKFGTLLFDKDNKSDNPISSDVPIDNGNNGGDTYIFNSPKPIDEIQAARLLRDTKRDLAEGF